MRILKIATIVILAFSVSSCCACRKKKSANDLPLTGTTWQLVQLQGAAFAAQQDAYTLVFDSEGKVNGKGDCNRLGGSYTVTDRGEMTISQIASTRMLCPNQSQESTFLMLLPLTDGYTVDGNMLMLFEKGESKLVFVAKEQ